jgi:hypothetical protein
MPRLDTVERLQQSIRPSTVSSLSTGLFRRWG